MREEVTLKGETSSEGCDRIEFLMQEILEECCEGGINTRGQGGVALHVGTGVVSAACAACCVLCAACSCVSRPTKFGLGNQSRVSTLCSCLLL